jgi:hypothetical protein
MSELAIELKNWLQIDVAQVFERFLSVATASSITLGGGDTRFLYVPGERRDRVVLLAHADTVWDAKPGYPAPVPFADGVFGAGSGPQARSTGVSATGGREPPGNPQLGIGADDRAGCALVWELRSLGHSLLITSGEEKGCLSSHWIADHNPDVLAELNTHQFMVQFDRRNAKEFKCYEVGSDPFRAYVQQQTGYTEPDRLRGTDIRVLCREVCGVNLSCGYYDEHTPAETIVFAEWEHTLNVARAWLSQHELPKFALGTRLPTVPHPGSELPLARPEAGHRAGGLPDSRTPDALGPASGRSGGSPSTGCGSPEAASPAGPKGELAPSGLPRRIQNEEETMNDRVSAETGRRSEITNSAISAEISQREQAWMDAWLHRDMEAAAAILGDEFTLTSSLSSGELMNKSQWLAGAVSTHTCEAFHFDRIDVRVYGETALANMWYHQKATVRGNDWSGNFLMSDLWVRRGGRWQVVARHASWLKPASQ